MTEPTPEGHEAAEAARAARPPAPVDRRTLDEIFGDVLPSITQDEMGDGNERSDADRERWYRDNRPPHHG